MSKNSTNNGKPQRPMFNQNVDSATSKPKPEAPKPRTSAGVPTLGEANARLAAQGKPLATSSRKVHSASSSKSAPSSAQRKATPAPIQHAPSAGTITRKPKKKKKAGLIILLFFIALLLAIILFLVIFYNIIQTRMDGRKTDDGTIPVEHRTERLFPEYSGTGILNFLVCGIDYDNEAANGFTSAEKIGRTDLILYAQFDPAATTKIKILQIPRDIFVGDKVNTGKGKSQTYKINSLYFNAEDTDNRVSALSQVLVDQFQLPVDFYITIDMDAVKEIIDIRGSINVYVPVDIDDLYNPGTYISQGWHHFTGEETEIFLRARHSTSYKEQGDIARLQTQQYFYSALYREFTDLAPQDLYMWMDVLTYRIKTDENLMSLGSLAAKALNIKSSDITLIRPPCGSVMYKGQSVLSLDAEGTAEVLNEYFRMEGHSVPANELDIYELPMYLGLVPTSVRTIGEVQSTEAPMPK